MASVSIAGATPQIGDRDTVSAWIGTSGERQQVFSPGVALWDDPDAQVSFINLATVRAIGSTMGVDLDPLRFRANVYLDGLQPWEELGWVGRRVQIGDAVIDIFGAIERCRATSAPPGSNGWDLNVPGALAAHYGHIHNGVYGRIIKSGQVRVDDTATPTSVFNIDRVMLDEPEDTIRAPRVADVVESFQSAPDTWSVTFRDSYNLLNTAHAGQHLRIHRLEATADWRNYTISGNSQAGARITFRRNMSGRFSPWVTSLRAGDRVIVSGPHGTAHIEQSASTPIVVLTAGIGITPALSIAQSLAEGKSVRQLRLLHVDRAAELVPHLDELAANADSLANARLDVFLTGDQSPTGRWHNGRPDPEFIRQAIDDPTDVAVFICGPKPFLSDMTDACRQRGVPHKSIHIDPFYSPPSPNLEPRDPPKPGPFRVRWPDNSISSWTPDEGTLLDLAEAAGHHPPAGCRSGACGTCQASVSGETCLLLDTFAQPGEGRTLLCSSVPVGDLDVTSFS